MVADEGVKVPAACEKRLGRGGGELDEDRVDGRFVEQRYPGKPAEGGGEFFSLRVGVGGVAEPSAGFEDRAPLGAGETLFGGELAGLFHAVGEISGEGFVKKDDSLGGEQTVFGAAETEDIDAGAPREIGGAMAVGGGGGAGVGEAGPVHVHGEAVGVREIGKGANGRGRIECAVFRRLRERERTGLGKMHAMAAGERGGDGGGGELAGRAGQREELAAAGEKFRGAAFVGVDVGDLVAEHALVAGAEGGEREGVGGGAVEDKERLAIGGEELPEKLVRAGGGGVFAVAGDAGGVGGVEGGEGFGADAGGVVAGKREVVAGGHGVERRGWGGAGRQHFRRWQRARWALASRADAMKADDVNLYLVGFMGTGKSTVGRALAQRLAFACVDSDHEIERVQKKTIPAIFAELGEPAFRGMERVFIEEGHPATRTVVACGGGLVVQPGMLARVQARGVVICLHASVETILARTSRQNNRPLLNVEDPEARIRKLFAERDPIYRSAGSVILTDGRPMNDIIAHVVRTWRRDSVEFARAAGAGP